MNITFDTNAISVDDFELLKSLLKKVYDFNFQDDEEIKKLKSELNKKDTEIVTMRKNYVTKEEWIKLAEENNKLKEKLYELKIIEDTEMETIKKNVYNTDKAVLDESVKDAVLDVLEEEEKEEEEREQRIKEANTIKIPKEPEKEEKEEEEFSIKGAEDVVKYMKQYLTDRKLTVEDIINIESEELPKLAKKYSETKSLEELYNIFDDTILEK